MRRWSIRNEGQTLIQVEVSTKVVAGKNEKGAEHTTIRISRPLAPTGDGQELSINPQEAMEIYGLLLEEGAIGVEDDENEG